VRGSVESSRGAHGTHPHIFERHQPGDTVATNNHFRHVRGAKMRMSCCSEEKAQQLSHTEIYWIEVNLKNLKTTLINCTRARTKGQSAGYPQAQIEITFNFFQRRTP